MIIPIKQIILEVTVNQLENGYKKTIINNGKLIRRTHDKIFSSGQTGAITTEKIPTTAITNTENMIRTYSKDPVKLTNDLKKLNQLKNQKSFIYSKGQQYKPDVVSNINDKNTKNNLPNIQRGTNALVNNHEMNEWKLINSKNVSDRADTSIGNENGHKSLSKILGIERNNIIKGDDIIRSGGIPMLKMRNDSGEAKLFNELLPVNNKSKTFIDDYNSPIRLNRRFLKEMHKKERGMLGRSDSDIKNFSKFLINNSFAPI